LGIYMIESRINELRIIKGVLAEIRCKNKLLRQRLVEGKISGDDAEKVQNVLISEYSDGIARLDSIVDS
jgi:hypothetical protein